MKMNTDWRKEKKKEALLILHLYKVFVDFKRNKVNDVLLFMYQQGKNLSYRRQLKEFTCTIKIIQRYCENGGQPGRLQSLKMHEF